MKTRLKTNLKRSNALADIETEELKEDAPTVSVGKKSGLLGDMDINAKVELPKETIITIGGVIALCAILIAALVIANTVIKAKLK